MRLFWGVTIGDLGIRGRARCGCIVFVDPVPLFLLQCLRSEDLCGGFESFGRRGSDASMMPYYCFARPHSLSPLATVGFRFVLLSSAAVTRPNWSAEDKALYPLVSLTHVFCCSFEA